MSSNQGLTHLIMKRIQPGFVKNRQMSTKSKKINDRIIDNSMEGINFNLSVDVKNHMTKQKDQFKRQRPSNTINLQMEQQKAKRKNKLLFFSSKRQSEGNIYKSLKLAYGNSSPKTIKHRVHIYTSQKSIKQKSKRFSLSTNIRGESELLQHVISDSSPDHTNTKQHQTVNMEKHMIITKYEKVKQLLKDQKYPQASIYLKQIIPHIEDKSKKKQLYFWLIASLMKSTSHSKLETIEGYIVECLEQFPNFYDVYLYWGKSKMIQDQRQDAIQIYEKAISINNKNSEAYVQLANVYVKSNLFAQALRTLKQGFTNSINSVSIPIMIIENYKMFSLNLEENNLKTYLERIQSNCGKKSTELLYILGFIEKQKNNLNQALICFLESIKFNSNRNHATKSLQNLIKIHVFKKDFYAAFYDLKRAKYLNIDLKKIEKYQLFLQGVNYVMKKQNEEGIKLLNQIKQSSTKSSSKKRINYFIPTKNSEQNKTSFSGDPQILSLTIKYLAYAYFKLGNHKEAIKCYKLLEKIDQELDKTSKYNMLLAEGIVLADFYQDFQASFSKFQEAKIYLCKVQPWIYQAVVTIQRQIYKQKKQSKHKVVLQNLIEQELNSSVIEALNIMEEGFHVNSSSSNLLYHRTILHLYFSSLKTGMQDINLCIQKAEQNLPKYFYIRGVCFACMKNLKKAINEFSISISLSKDYSLAYLQRAKCYFLSGQTEMGFQDLKVYMDRCPNDSFVHKWIGDLLFEGTSYTDSIKAYNQMGSKITLDAFCMRIKAELRVSNIKHIAETMNLIKAHSQFHGQVFGIDIAAFNLLFCLTTLSGSNDKEKVVKEIQRKVKELNDFLQGDDVEKGKIFNLVDCMSLVGIGNFYSEKYIEAYESFLLVLEFLKSTKNRDLQKSKLSDRQDQQQEEEKQIVQKQKLNTEFQQEAFDLRQEDVYYNIFICLLALKDLPSVKKLVDEEMTSIVTSKTQRKVIDKIVQFINENMVETDKHVKVDKNASSYMFSENRSKVKTKKQNVTCLFEPRIENPLNSSMKKVQIIVDREKSFLLIKTSLIWSSYHGTNDNLNFTTFAKKLVNQLHAGYIDNMPQGPWIRRNEFGVLFTDNILDQGNESSFITTNRPEQDPQANDGTYQKEQYEDDQYDSSQIGEAENYRKPYNSTKDKNKDTIEDKKKAFLKEMKLDLRVQDKLKKLIKQNEEESEFE